MRKIIFAVVCSIFIFSTALAWGSAFCEGWHDGYIVMGIAINSLDVYHQ